LPLFVPHACLCPVFRKEIEMICNTPFQEIINAILIISKRLRELNDTKTADAIEKEIYSIPIHSEKERDEYIARYEQDRKNKPWWRKLL